MNKTVIALMNEVEMALGSNYEVRCGGLMSRFSTN